MADQSYPKKNSNAERILNAVHALGGNVKANQLMSFLRSDARSKSTFIRALSSLEIRGFVIIEHGGLVNLSAEAKRQFSQKAQLPVLPLGQVAGKRQAVIRPIRTRAAGPIRPGADDYKSIPSLYSTGVAERQTVGANGSVSRTIVVAGYIRKLPSGEVVD